MSLKNLIDIALIGTEKKTLDTQLLPAEIATIISTRQGSDSEQQLLEAIALTYFYEKAGESPVKFAGIWNDTIIEETLTLADAAFLDLFSKIKLEDHQVKEYLIHLWLDALIEKQQIVNSDSVTLLLKEGNTLSLAIKEKIVRVIGSRGAWALSQSSIYNYKQPPPDEQLWQEGATPERKNLLGVLHQADPVKAWGLLEGTWSTESVVNKRGFLEIISGQSTQADIPYLEKIFETEFVFHPKEKKTEKECRRIVAEILLRYPQSKIYTTTTSSLTRYVESEKGLTTWVTGKRKVSISLPENEDLFWSAHYFDETYGLETKNIDSALYPHNALYWLSFFIEVLPVEFWITFFNDTIDDSVDFFLNNEKFKAKIGGKQESIYKSALLKNIQSLRSESLTKAMIQLIPVVEMLPYLKYLDKKDFESFIDKNAYHADAGIVGAGPYDLHQTWSLDFSSKVIAKEYDKIVQGNASYYIGKMIARFADHGSYVTLIHFHNKLKEANNFTAFDIWNKTVFTPAHNALEIRKQIDEYKLKKS